MELYRNTAKELYEENYLHLAKMSLEVKLAKLLKQLTDHIGDNDIHVTADDKKKWNDMVSKEEYDLFTKALSIRLGGLMLDEYGDKDPAGDDPDKWDKDLFITLRRLITYLTKKQYITQSVLDETVSHYLTLTDAEKTYLKIADVDGRLRNYIAQHFNSLVYIGDDENWVINGINTKKPSRGPLGILGIQGIQGILGPQGNKGDKGDKGDKGNTGDKGNPGNNGDDAISYYITVDYSSVTYDQATKTSSGSFSATGYEKVGSKSPNRTSKSLQWSADGSNWNGGSSNGNITASPKNASACVLVRMISGSTVYASVVVPVSVKGKDGKDGLDGKSTTATLLSTYLRYRTKNDNLGVFLDGNTAVTDGNSAYAGLKPKDFIMWSDGDEATYGGTWGIYICNSTTSYSTWPTYSLITDTSKWTKANYGGSAYFDTLISKYIAAQSITTDQLVVTADKGKTVVGGMTGADAIPKTPNGANDPKLTNQNSTVIWAGNISNADVSTAPFHVNRDGKLTASNANITGVIRTNNIFHDYVEVTANTTHTCTPDTEPCVYNCGPGSIVILPNPSLYQGLEVTIFAIDYEGVKNGLVNLRTSSAYNMYITCTYELTQNSNSNLNGYNTPSLVGNVLKATNIGDGYLQCELVMNHKYTIFSTGAQWLVFA